MKDVVYCISDAHFGIGSEKEEKRKEKNLFAFLNRVKRENADLIINGDLFDFYFEYNSVIPRKYFDILAKLKEIIQSGIRVWFVAGNHDFWVGPFFEKDIGVRVIRKSMKFKFYGKKIFVAHGDGLGRFDLGHLLLQLLLRQPLNIFLFSFLHPNIAYILGRWVSKMSRKKSSSRNFTMDGNPLKRFVKSEWEKGFDVVILGHIHYPYLEKKNEKIFAIIGDWIDNFSYIRITKEGVSLQYIKE